MLILTDEQQVTLSVAFKTAKGNPATVDGAPTWRSSDDSIATVEPSADGLSAVVKAAGPVGTVQVSVEADADLGTGSRLITGTLDIDVRAAEAVVADIAAGAPETQP
jgi:hypothetical protein